VVEADPPEENTFEVLDDLYFLDKGRDRLQVVAAGITRRSIRVLIVTGWPLGPESELAASIA